ncbi:5-Methylcytosine G/T mismatch-specific DNA glycosylase, putative [Beauveria bassiana ARSEF 2860]|uniref:5-Methylcytosine G/T mismatch-specific DNA glycosylase, putative n=1 Tax=Beauveria bassiana (strain ARSEF 2860) TaxID=655819 RepID=J5K3A9_BEAB2|nr:5-Methylcytosine G/T mismatch-specific DNA glycosylase, putative [Beauveria bassiana ARSEF 2860]EJP68561.1 5-Methylcytosine G/T mismatch-specific DNA glycosylase, putative [Beauveria bassiana ARSEF 2860]
MPTDASADDDRPHEKQRRSKSERKPDRERDRERDKNKDKDKDRERRHRSSKSSRSKVSGEEADAGSQVSSVRRHRKREKDRDRARDDGDDRSSLRTKSLSDVNGRGAPPSPQTASLFDGKRVSLPYPSFSKAHSKEAVISRDNLSPSRGSHIPTPEPTDAVDDDGRRKSDDVSRKGSTSKKSSRPPTPPETDLSADKRKSLESRLSSSHSKDRERTKDKPTASGVSRSASRNEEGSRVSRRSASSSQATYIKSANHKSHEKLRTSESRFSSSSSRHSPHRSGSTRSVRRPEGRDGHSSPSSVQDSSPRTPTQAPQFSTPFYDQHGPERPDSSILSKTATPAPAPPPPPPPPPAMDLYDVPRVDYLLQNGGLPCPVPRHFLSVLPIQNGARGTAPPLSGSDTLFAPFFNLLDQYNTVIEKHGSIAVATGHRSVARRLLDRLENVFSRDLPPHGCSCILCDRSNDMHHGLTWGDVLEWVSGRIELPEWPPFDLAEIGTRAAEISAEEPRRPSSPIKLDPDIAEEFREHYLRQTKKVRSAVDKWLNSTPETPIPPPQEVDDETLAFAILTNLDDHDRPYFNALLSGARELKPATRAPTPMLRQRNDFVVKTGLSLQRLYRLQQAPRDAESVTYLIKNPHTHDLLVTLSNINNSEWEILTSGRFDGFLWSGADMDDQVMTPGLSSRSQTPANGYFGSRSTMSPGPRSSSAMSSRGPTPFSRGATPASFVSTSSVGPSSRLAVSNDEETEMAAIAEMEREIYQGMESLEDAFEKLHHRAEVVRTALRQRGAGLMQSLQSRRRVDVLPAQTPTPGAGQERASWAPSSEGEAPSDDDWFEEYDIMPDDSASNISSSRHRRPKRRTERRTPAPIEEDEEE